jgi:hypothetical protein
MRRNLFLMAALSAALSSAPALAGDISPWTPVAGSVEAELAVSKQKAERFYAGKALVGIPTGAELEQDAITLSLSYGISERVAVDLEIGYAKSKFPVVPGLAPRGGTDGLSDVVLGLRLKALDEVDGAPITATFGVAAIIDGGYPTGALSAIGDGGSGGQFTLALGKQLGPVSLSTDLGYRTKGNKVPDELFGSVQASLAVSNGISLYGGLSFVNSKGNLNIGGPGFSPARFPEVEEDYKLWTIGASAAIGGSASVNLTYGQKFDGRNTARSNVIRLGVGYAF